MLGLSSGCWETPNKYGGRDFHGVSRLSLSVLIVLRRMDYHICKLKLWWRCYGWIYFLRVSHRRMRRLKAGYL